MIWTRPKQIVPVQNDWYSTKMNWTVQNHFVPIEVQGIRVKIQNSASRFVFQGRQRDPKKAPSYLKTSQVA